MSEVLFCFNCKHFEYNSISAACTRDAARDVVYGSHTGIKYVCHKERGYDNDYIVKSIANNHVICGFEGKFFEAKQ